MHVRSNLWQDGNGSEKTVPDVGMKVNMQHAGDP